MLRAQTLLFGSPGVQSSGCFLPARPTCWVRGQGAGPRHAECCNISGRKHVLSREAQWRGSRPSVPAQARIQRKQGRGRTRRARCGMSELRRTDLNGCNWPQPLFRMPKRSVLLKVQCGTFRNQFIKSS